MSDVPTDEPAVSALARIRIHARVTRSAAAAHFEIEEDALVDIEAGTAQAPTTLLANMARLYGANPHLLVKAYLADRRW